VKKVLCLLILIVGLAFSLFVKDQIFCSPIKDCIVYASDESNPYARITNASTFFYSSPNSLEASKMFLLPETYFVELLADAVDGYYQAKYLEIQGYVLKSDIKCVAKVPATPFVTDASFRVFAQNGLNIRSTPKESEGISNKLGTVAFMENNIQFYGTIEGEEAVPFRGSTWVFCKYSSPTGSEIFGYLYAGFCDMFTPIPKNLEVAEYVENPTFRTSISESETSGEIFGQMSAQQQIVLLVLLSIPAIFVIWLLFKPSQLATGKIKRSAKTKSRLDYFELD